MSKFLAGARRPALCIVSVASMLAGGATLWAVLDPQTVRNASTWLLVGVLALLTLPLLTLTAFEADRRSRVARQAARRTRAMAEQFAHEAVVAHDIAHTQPLAGKEDASRRRHEPAAVEHHDPKAVSARRPARSAPGRSRAASRR